MPATGPPTILFEVFWTQQKRKRLVEVALEGTELPPDDYPFYVTIGADGPLTPTALAELLDDAALDGHVPAYAGSSAAATPSGSTIPSDGRSYLIRLTPEGRRLLNKARPRFRSYAEAVEARLGSRKTTALRDEPDRAPPGDRRGAGRQPVRTRCARIASGVGTPPCRMNERGSR